MLHLYVVRSYFLAGGALEAALEGMAHLASLDPAREALAAQAWQSKQLELLAPPLRFVAGHPRRDEIVELIRDGLRRHDESFADVLPLSVAA
ncbi:MAG: hypothetical protein IT379_34235 [Deltaproteobacteria bacterium]|nr:hypothetical protein [Deltaproteobacteria bacterium]